MFAAAVPRGVHAMESRTEDRHVFGTILVTLDGSAMAEKALPYAGIIARRSGSGIILFAVCGDDPVERQRFEAYLDRVADRMRSWGMSVGTRCVPHGQPADEIVNFSEENGIGLMVMCTHGGGGISRWYSGSVSRKVAEESYVPLLLVKGGGVQTGPAYPVMRNILVALDGSQSAEAVIPLALTVVNGSEGEIILFGVNEAGEMPGGIESPSSPGWAAYYEKTVSAAHRELVQYLEALARRYQSARAAVRAEVALGKPAETILAFSESHDVDAIAISTHGRSGFSPWAFGSVANKVVWGSSKPILILRPKPNILEGGRAEKKSGP